MEEKKYPSLPSNYVTLVQLQERWIKEQQKKLIEKERQEQEEEERRREEQRLINEQDKQKHNEDEERPETHPKSITRRRNWRSYNRRTIAVRHLEPEGPEDQPQTEAVVVVGEETHEQDGNNDESKRKKKNRYRKGKPKKEEEVTGGAELPAPENVEEENILVRRDDEKEENILVRRDDERKGLHGGLNISVRRDGERKGMCGEFRYKSKIVVKGKVSEPDDHLTMEIGRKFEDLSINRGKEEGKDRSRIERNGGPWRYRGSGRFNSHRGERIWKPRDSGLVWVKKGEISNGNVARVQYPQENRRRNQSSLIGIASFAE